MHKPIDPPDLIAAVQRLLPDCPISPSFYFFPLELARIVVDECLAPLSEPVPG